MQPSGWGPTVPGKRKPQPPSPSCASGYKALQGLRPYMEDCHFILPHFYSVTDTHQRTSAFHFFGICDGHGGASVSQRCAVSIPRNLREELNNLSTRLAAPEFRQQLGGVGIDVPSPTRRSHEGRLPHPIERAMVNAFKAADRELTEDPQLAEEAKWMGTTALAALVDSQHIWIANCGDCRAVLSRAGTAVCLTSDHKPTCPFEAARVEGAGGVILRNSGTRVMGILAVSRALGDHALQPHGLTPIPETRHIRRHPADQFMILASDGLWDVISNQEAVDLVTRVFKRVVERGAEESSAPASPSPASPASSPQHTPRQRVPKDIHDPSASPRTPKTPRHVSDPGGPAPPASPRSPPASTAPRVAASVLARVAVNRGSGDNITVIVVDLRQAEDVYQHAAMEATAVSRRAMSVQTAVSVGRWAGWPRLGEGRVGGLFSVRSVPAELEFDRVCDRALSGGGDMGCEGGVEPVRLQSVH